MTQTNIKKNKTRVAKNTPDALIEKAKQLMAQAKKIKADSQKKKLELAGKWLLKNHTEVIAVLPENLKAEIKGILDDSE